MKRMYVVLGLILIAMIWAVSSLGQMMVRVQKDESFDRLKRRMELREEMHRRMRDKILRGFGSDQDIFRDMDQMFDEAFKDSLSGFDDIATENSNFKSEWQETDTGRVLVITPQSEDQKLDIDVKNEVITIKGMSEQKTNTSSVMSSFTNSFSVPDDCDGSKVKMSQKDGKILVEFPYRETKAITTPRKEERRPLPPSESDVTI